MKPDELRGILDQMSQREQIFAGCCGALLDAIDRLNKAEISESYLFELTSDVFNTMMAITGMPADVLQWVLQFLCAGPSTSASGPAPSSAEEAIRDLMRKNGLNVNEVNVRFVGDGAAWPTEWPTGPDELPIDPA